MDLGLVLASHFRHLGLTRFWLYVSKSEILQKVVVITVYYHIYYFFITEKL